MPAGLVVEFDLEVAVLDARDQHAFPFTMSTLGEPSQPPEIKELVISLNDLLDKLHIPIFVETPLDLTPALLLGILECILRARLPIASSIRRSRDLVSKVQAMKIFLGVLEHDVIGEDVGLSDVDPRKLAVGEWDEVVFVGELLCWLGKKNGILPLGDVHDIIEEAERQPEDIVEVAHDPEPAKLRPRIAPLSTHSTGTVHDSSTDTTTLSFLPSANPESDTTMQSHTHTYTHPRIHSPPLSDLDIFNTTIRDYRTSPVPSSSRRMLESEWASEEGEPEPQEPEEHEAFEELSFDPVGHSTFQGPIESENEYDHRISTTSKMNRDYPPETARRTPKTRIPVRYDGYLNEVDEEEEIRSFEASRDYTQRMADLTISSPSPLSRSSRQDKPLGKAEGPRYPSGLSRTSTPRRPSSSNTTPTGHTSVPRIVTRHNSPSQHALALMSERARLKEELAQIKARRRS